MIAAAHPRIAPDADLRQQGETLAAGLPALLAQADQLAATLLVGDHGRRHAGLGDEFWQFRPTLPGDSARMIDWRRSGRSDAHFVREKEWQAAQSVMFWVDGGQSMTFSGQEVRPAKLHRAALLALAAASALLRGDERVGLIGQQVPPRGGRSQLARLAEALVGCETPDDYGSADGRGLPAGSRAVFLSDFLGDIAPVERAMADAAAHGVRGVLLQVLDPAEEEFPFDGRTIFESMSGALRFETLKAGDLRSRYLARLAERKDRLSALARAGGWQYHCHHTGTPAQAALLWLYGALERGH